MRKLQARFPLKTGDIALCGALLFAAAAILISGFWAPSGGTGLVFCDGEIVYSLRLSPGEPPRALNVDSLGVHLRIETDGGRMRVASSDCPDQVCVRAGWIERRGGVVVCAPAKVALRIEGTASGTDAVLR